MADAEQQNSHKDEEDLAPTQTDGYKAPEKKTLEELKQLDQNDEALRKWKESLLGGSAAGAGKC